MAILTFPTTQSLLGQAPRVPLRPAEPVVATAAAPITAAEETPEQKAAKRYEAAFRNAMLNPNMPVEQQFSTGSARTDAEVLRRAQIATALSNAQAAIQERRNLQAMQAGMSPTSGVQQVGGTRVAFRNGVPVGIAQDTGVAPQRVQGQTGPSVLSPEQTQVNRMRIAELAQQATARDAAARALMGARPAPAATAPVASAARVAPAAPVAAAALPVTPLQAQFSQAVARGDMAAADRLSADPRMTAIQVDPVTIAEMRGPAPEWPTLKPVGQLGDGGRTAEQEAVDISEGATILAVEEQNQRAKADLDNRVTAATNKLVAASRTGRLAEIRAARQELNRVQSERQKFLASITPTSFEGGSTPFVGAAAPMF